MNNVDMTEYVTRGELRDNLEIWGGALHSRIEEGEQRTARALLALEQRFEQRFERIDQRFERIDQRFERIDQRFEQMDQRFEQVEQSILDLEQRLSNELGRHVKAILESMQSQFAALDDKFSPLLKKRRSASRAR